MKLPNIYRAERHTIEEHRDNDVCGVLRLYLELCPEGVCGGEGFPAVERVGQRVTICIPKRTTDTRFCERIRKRRRYVEIL